MEGEPTCHIEIPDLNGSVVKRERHNAKLDGDRAVMLADGGRPVYQLVEKESIPRKTTACSGGTDASAPMADTEGSNPSSDGN